MAQRTIHIGNLASSVREEHLRKYLAMCGQITNVKLAGDPNYPARFAFIEFSTPASAQYACTHLNGMELDGKNIKIQMAKSAISSSPSPSPRHPSIPNLPNLPNLIPQVRVGAPGRSVERTVYVTGIDESFGENDIYEHFKACGNITNHRICGEIGSSARFAFFEFSSNEEAIRALNLNHTLFGKALLRVSFSKTAIQGRPPLTIQQRELAERTVHVGYVDVQLSNQQIRHFFTKTCGPVTKVAIAGDSDNHSTRFVFVEFATKEAAQAALRLNGTSFGGRPIRINPSRSPILSTSGSMHSKIMSTMTPGNQLQEQQQQQQQHQLQEQPLQQQGKMQQHYSAPPVPYATAPATSQQHIYANYHYPSPVDSAYPAGFYGSQPHLQEQTPQQPPIHPQQHGYPSAGYAAPTPPQHPYWGGSAPAPASTPPQHPPSHASGSNAYYPSYPPDSLPPQHPSSDQHLQQQQQQQQQAFVPIVPQQHSPKVLYDSDVHHQPQPYDPTRHHPQAAQDEVQGKQQSQSQPQPSGESGDHEHRNHTGESQEKDENHLHKENAEQKQQQTMANIANESNSSTTLPPDNSGIALRPSNVPDDNSSSPTPSSSSSSSSGSNEKKRKRERSFDLPNDTSKRKKNLEN